MKVEFIKDHPSGIKKGEKFDFPEEHVARLTKGGYLKEKGPKDSDEKKSSTKK